jgi:hypothetical protein
MGLGCTIHAVIPGMNVDEAILVAVRAVEVAGIAALLLGAILASAAFLRDWFRAGLGGRTLHARSPRCRTCSG